MHDVFANSGHFLGDGFEDDDDDDECADAGARHDMYKICTR